MRPGGFASPASDTLGHPSALDDTVRVPERAPVLSWAEFARARPDLAEAGRRLLYQFGVGLGFLATVRPDGSPRLHPMCPLVTEDALVGFLLPRALPLDGYQRSWRLEPQHLIWRASQPDPRTRRRQQGRIGPATNHPRPLGSRPGAERSPCLAHVTVPMGALSARLGSLGSEHRARH